jgi:acyl-coenzyme A synthetase/AMP-(fatty) acid ligase
MTLSVYNDDGSINKHEIKKELLYDETLKNRVSYIGSSKKEENALNFFKSYYSDSKSILFDSSNKSILEELERLDVPSFNSKEKTNNIFNDKEFSFLYFTSGSTGFPVGALKTKENLFDEIEQTTKVLEKYNIKKVIVTVPFIHVYGTLFGLIYPFMNDIDIVLKEHFLPNDLLDFCEENCLVVTTPLYIKSLNRLQTTKDLSKTLFVSSTAPLFPDVAKEFNEKFNTNVMHIFGSTETGGAAYKYNTEDFWTPMSKVIISTNDKEELHIKSPYVSKFLYEKEFKDINQEIQTFDYVEIKNNKFKLLGRSSQILKVSGKRYSTIQIEAILEEIPQINKALVFVKKDDKKLKEEILDITLESEKQFKEKEITKILQDKLSNIKFSMDLKYVDKIKVSSVGKKLKI